MTIDEILTAFAAGTYKQELAEHLLHGMMVQTAKGERRSAYARAALTGLLGGEKRPSRDDVAREAFAYAQAMIQAEKPGEDDEAAP